MSPEPINPSPDSLQQASANEREVFTKLKDELRGIEFVHDMVGENVFTVPVDDGQELQSLRDAAQALRDLPFLEKVDALTQLTLSATGKNAVALSTTDEDARDLVHSSHPLSDALKTGKGCCRYQALLFFILAREAKLGVSHSLLTQRLGQSFFSVYNLVFDEQHQGHAISVYNQSLGDAEARKKYGYPNPSGNPMMGYDFSRQQEYYAYVADAKLGDELPIIIKAKGNLRTMEKWNTDFSLLRK